MKSYKEIFKQATQTILLNMHGYVGPVKGADEHWSYRFDEGQEILLIFQQMNGILSLMV